MSPSNPNPSTLIVSNLKAIKFLQDTTRSRYLLPFVARSCNIKRAADGLGVSIAVLGYWVRKMLELGLIRLERVETRKGSPIKFYRAVADQIIVPVQETTLEQDVALLEGQFGSLWRRLLHSSVLAARALTPDWQIRFFRDGLGLAQVSVEPSENLESLNLAWRQPLNHWHFLHLRPEEAKQLRSELEALLHRYGRQAGPDLEPYLLHVGLVRDFGPEP